MEQSMKNKFPYEFLMYTIILKTRMHIEGSEPPFFDNS